MTKRLPLQDPRGRRHLCRQVLACPAIRGRSPKSNLSSFIKDDEFGGASHCFTIGVDFVNLSHSENKESLSRREDRQAPACKPPPNQWDTAGQERFKTITRSYYRGAHAIMFVYDIGTHQSLDDIEHWVEEASKYKTKDVSYLLIGNKSDIKREVPLEKGEVSPREAGSRQAARNALHRNICQGQPQLPGGTHARGPGPL